MQNPCTLLSGNLAEVWMKSTARSVTSHASQLTQLNSLQLFTGDLNVNFNLDGASVVKRSTGHVKPSLHLSLAHSRNLSFSILLQEWSKKGTGKPARAQWPPPLNQETAVLLNHHLHLPLERTFLSLLNLCSWTALLSVPRIMNLGSTCSQAPCGECGECIVAFFNPVRRWLLVCGRQAICV